MVESASSSSMMSNMMLDDAWAPEPGPDLVPTPRKCRRHRWQASGANDFCVLCGTVRDAGRSRRNRNNGKRGRADEAVVAKIIGGRKVGPLGLPWDVEIEGYLRAQCKHLDKWPSIATIVTWLDAIPVGKELRAVTLADTPGAGHRTRRLIVMDLDEWAGWHAGGK